MQLSPVTHLTITPLPDKEGCLKLTWSHKIKIPSFPIIFRVEHKASGDEQFTVSQYSCYLSVDYFFTIQSLSQNKDLSFWHSIILCFRIVLTVLISLP